MATDDLDGRSKTYDVGKGLHVFTRENEESSGPVTEGGGRPDRILFSAYRSLSYELPV